MDDSLKGVPSSDGDSENLDTGRACIFCKVVKGEISEGRVLESENFIVLKDINPHVTGHSMVISKKHYGTFLDLPAELYREFLEITREATVKLLKEYDAPGFNLKNNGGEIAGQVIPHFHMHIMPRKEGDGYNHRL